MPRPLADISNPLSITATEYATSPDYKYTAPQGFYAVIEQVSFAPDGTFKSVGSMKMDFQGFSVTNQSVAGNGVSTPNGFTLVFQNSNPRLLAIVEPNQSINAWCKVSSGTGSVQFLVTGYLLSPREFADLQQSDDVVKLLKEILANKTPMVL